MLVYFEVWQWIAFAVCTLLFLFIAFVGGMQVGYNIREKQFIEWHELIFGKQEIITETTMPQVHFSQGDSRKRTDYRQDYAKVVNDNCPTDEIHCGCVPILRRENRLMAEELADAKDELKHRRDALIDAQEIYNDANNHRFRYLSALELIASFVNAKDKTTVDELIAIAGKELSIPSDRILDACNYWVMKLREEENKSRLVYIVTMYRYGDREKHSYVYGAFSNENIAREWSEKEKDYRGGKYEPEIIRFCVDSPTDFLKVKNA